MDGYMKMINSVTEFNNRVPVLKRKILIKELLYNIIPDNSLVLDFGCGNGTIESVLGRGIVVEGFDIDRENPGAKYHSSSEIGDKKFDIILLSHVIEHMELKETLEVLNWCAEHADSVIIALPNAFHNPWMFFYDDITHVRPYNNTSFLLKVEEIGFQVKTIYLINHEPGIRRLLFDWIFQCEPYQEHITYATKKSAMTRRPNSG